jgi:hypothetical protein
MCVALKYVVDGKTRTAAAGVQGVTVPVLMHSGQVRWVEWGAPTGRHVSDPDGPGYIMKLPAGNWVDLVTLREGAWWRYKPRPVKIAPFHDSIVDKEVVTRVIGSSSKIGNAPGSRPLAPNAGELLDSQFLISVGLHNYSCNS